MWNDVVVGSGKALCSAVTVYGFDKSKPHISQNRTAYWVSDAILGLGVTIYKNTDEGATLQRLIEQGCSKQVVEDFIDRTILAHIEIDVLRHAIQNALQNAHGEGRIEKTAEIHKVLGLS